MSCNATPDKDFQHSAKFANKTLHDFEVLSVIGNGTFGTCYKVQDKSSGEIYAWKCLDYDDLGATKRRALMSEIRMLRKLRHPNIVQYYDYVVNAQTKCVYIVMECCEGGDLAQLIADARKRRKRFDEPYVWRVLWQLCQALQFCHNNIKEGAVVHRDIKPANIFLDADGNAKLGDFGLARIMSAQTSDEKTTQSLVGTPYYMSPEIVRGAKYDCKSDVWALGCLVYELCALRPPFEGAEFIQLSWNISRGSYKQIPSVYTNDLKLIIAALLATSERDRPSIALIRRNPLLARNIDEQCTGLPQLVDADGSGLYSGLSTPKATHALYTGLYSFHEEYGQRQLKFSMAFTPDCRPDLLQNSTKRKLNQSDSMLYESVSRAYNDEAGGQPRSKSGSTEPAAKEEEIALSATEKTPEQLRELAAHLALREESLNARERALNAWERHLKDLEQRLNDRHTTPPTTMTPNLNLNVLPNTGGQAAMQPLFIDTTPAVDLLPPEFNGFRAGTTTTTTTFSKLDLAALPETHTVSTLRRIALQKSKPAPPTKLLAKPPEPALSKSGHFTNFVGVSQAKLGKSIRSIFGLSRTAKEQKIAAPTKQAATFAVPAWPQPTALEPEPDATSELANNHWTAEQKRTAFDLLAAMNASNNNLPVGATCSLRRPPKLRQALRSGRAIQLSAANIADNDLIKF